MKKFEELKKGIDYTIAENGNRKIITFLEKNNLKEKMIIELTKCHASKNKNGNIDKKSLPYLWYKNGYINRILMDYIGVNTYVYDSEGNCYMKYNVQVKNDNKSRRNVINFNYMLENKKENEKKLIELCYNKFKNASGLTATEKKINKIHEYANKYNLKVVKELPKGWKDIGALTVPNGCTLISNMKSLKSRERKQALLLI